MVLFGEHAASFSRARLFSKKSDRRTLWAARVSQKVVRMAQATANDAEHLAEVIRLLQQRGEAGRQVKERANALRKRVFGDEVHLRGIIEISNRCAKNCTYCGIRAANRALTRYTMTEDEIINTAGLAAAGGCRTVVLQAGEPPAMGDAALERIIRRIDQETGLAITLSCGVRPPEVYAAWKAAGMRRYLLRFETSSPGLYARLHPDSNLAERLEALRTLRRLGVQVGSGFLIGIPGEEIETLANNILLCRELGLDMIGVGPFIAHQGTPLAGMANRWADDPEMFFMTIAVLRLYNERAHIPATTAYAALFTSEGREELLACGANVFMPDLTPQPYRAAYQLYPGKSDADTETEACLGYAKLRIEALGRYVAEGPGDAYAG